MLRIPSLSFALACCLASAGTAQGNPVNRFETVLRSRAPAPFAAAGTVLEEWTGVVPFFLAANRRGQFLMFPRITAGIYRTAVLYGFDPQVGFTRLTDLPGPTTRAVSQFGLSESGDVVITTFGPSEVMSRTHIGAFFGVPSVVSATAGGVHTLEIDADPSLGGLPYFIAGTISGTWPGTQVTPNVRIPLNLDPWTNASFGAINNVFSANFGVLDANGFAQSQMTVPTAVPQFAGTLFHHAYAVIEPGVGIRFVSEPATLRLF